MQLIYILLLRYIYFIYTICILSRSVKIMFDGKTTKYYIKQGKLKNV